MSKSNNGRNLVNSYKFEICIFKKNDNIHKSAAKENKMIKQTLPNIKQLQILQNNILFINQSS